tara:strand:- start:687 stop:1007 length:321 start_codon:yes stop_codon:yes gene_type:complete
MKSILEKAPEGGAEFDPFFVPDDWARLQYGRLLWKKERTRARLLRHWMDERHPYRDRFLNQYRSLVERVLTGSVEDDEMLDHSLQREGHSLRTIVREIPPVFGAFY